MCDFWILLDILFVLRDPFTPRYSRQKIFMCGLTIASIYVLIDKYATQTNLYTNGEGVTAYMLYVISHHPALESDALSYLTDIVRRVNLKATLYTIAGCFTILFAVLAIYHIVKKMNNQNNDRI